MLRIFIGYDSREPVAYHVAAHSIISRASLPVSIAPLARHQLSEVYWRLRNPMESTEFSLTRFLVPHLSMYRGYSLFMDCDMLVQADVGDLLDVIEAASPKTLVGRARFCPPEVVWVAKHNYTPKTETKMDGAVQTAYPCKNWSSVMLFNNERCRALSPEYVNTAPALDLHRFNWVVRPDEIATLPLEWNWLVGEYAENPNAKILHYTLGGPWFKEYRDCPHADLWLAEYRAMTGVEYHA